MGSLNGTYFKVNPSSPLILYNNYVLEFGTQKLVIEEVINKNGV